MDRNGIKKWQATKICEALFPTTNYLVRLRRRMEQVGFPHDDPLYLQVCAAYDAIRQLRLDFHYLSCDGTGRSTQRNDSSGTA